MIYEWRWCCLGLGAWLLAGCGGNPPPLADRPQAGVSGASGANATGLRRAAAGPSRYTLRAAQAWQLNLPRGERFDASGLVELPNGELLTVSDRNPVIHRILFRPGADSADLAPVPDCFTPSQLAPFAAEKKSRYDCEGIARDAAGRLYLCEEANHWVLRWDPKSKVLERLNIDWTPVRRFFSTWDDNASFEGIAVDGQRLYVANERSVGRLIVVDLETLKVTDHFVAPPLGSRARDVHYSDLSWFEGALYALLRESWVVLKIDPATHRVLAQYDYAEAERAPEVAYKPLYPGGIMEGLAVDRDYFWLVTDNNGQGRVRYPRDPRPTLFKCPRPDR